MMNVLRDLRQGFRLLLRAPGFAVTAALTLALGIGATTALFTVVNAVLLEPLPFPDSNKLIQVFTDLGAWAPRGVTMVRRPGSGAGHPRHLQRNVVHRCPA